MNRSYRAKSTLEQWRIFQAVVEQGGYAQAAFYLNKSQSSLNHAVGKLQNMLGVQLLQVTGRKAELTEIGQVMLRRSLSLTQGIEELEGLALNLQQGWEPEITLAREIIHPTAPVHQALKSFLPLSKGTRVKIIDTVMSGSEEMLTNGNCQLAIMPVLPKGYLGEPLINIEMILVIGASHSLAKRRNSLNVSDIAPHLQIVIRDTASQPKENQGWLRAEQRWTVGSFYEAIDLVKEGLAFAWLPRHLISAELRSEELIQLKVLGGSIKRMESYLVLPDAEQAGPATRLLFDQLLESHATSSS
ncbi:LysR family transcriptional regulator [Alginatibacterium sediminis]|uniref:LysR family transcriptional regulator n=1 Tax=Alginatibacterium sediminis TaxID=2164068 RepID=A0A420EHX9_9ALTE|nr:LysR family transcriptional regulator [Alginatibacterium sediminis]RKF20264.1 LysR family transcriptional regulator [Alginatibacterium sediminis]